MPNDPAQSGDQKPTGSDNQPTQTQQPQANDKGQEVDFAKLSGDQLAKVLENPELWKQPRIKELLESQKQLKQFNDQRAADEEKSLAEQKKFEELATKRGDEVTSLKNQIQTMTINQALTNELVKIGVIDLDAAIKLIGRDKISVDETGAVQGIAEAIESLKTDKAYLFNSNGNANNDKKLGSATNQNNNAGSGDLKFYRSQLQDPKFYAEHRKEILEASSKGLIVDDITK